VSLGVSFNLAVTITVAYAALRAARLKDTPFLSLNPGTTRRTLTETRLKTETTPLIDNSQPCDFAHELIMIDSRYKANKKQVLDANMKKQTFYQLRGVIMHQKLQNIKFISSVLKKSVRLKIDNIRTLVQN
jgi:hypothetical protein